MVAPLIYIFKFILNSLEPSILIIIYTIDNTNLPIFRFFPCVVQEILRRKIIKGAWHVN